MPSKSDHSLDPLARRLRTLVQESPELKDTAQLYEVILPILRDADLHIGDVSLTQEQVREKMDLGQPLLHGLNIELDIDAVRELMLRLVRAIEGLGTRNLPRILRLPWKQSSALSDTAMRRIGNAIEKDRLDLSVLLPHLAANDHGPIEEAARSLGLDPGLVTLLAQNVLKPALRALRVQVAPLAKDIAWNKCECYICGFTATLGELQENGQSLHLRCGQCGADWRFRRMRCPGCGNEDHRMRRYLYAEGQSDRMRAEVCDACRGYLKVIAAFTPTSPEMLPVEDLATLHLDHIAQERGYRRMGSM